MALTDRALLKKVQTGHCLSDGLTDAEGEVNKSHRRIVQWRKATIDTNAADNTAELTVGYLPRKTKLVAAKWTTDANVASSNADAINLIVAVRDGAGGSASNVAVSNTAAVAAGGVGALTLYVPTSVALVSANAVSIAAGSVVTFQVTKDNNGTKLDAGVLTLDFEEI